MLVLYLTGIQEVTDEQEQHVQRSRGRCWFGRSGSQQRGQSSWCGLSREKPGMRREKLTSQVGDQQGAQLVSDSIQTCG